MEEDVVVAGGVVGEAGAEGEEVGEAGGRVFGVEGVEEAVDGAQHVAGGVVVEVGSGRHGERFGLTKLTCFLVEVEWRWIKRFVGCKCLRPFLPNTFSYIFSFPNF